MLLERILGRVTEPHRLSKLEQFKKIKDRFPNDKIFVHYTMISKLGINPKSSFKTPIGIYSYPLDYLISIGGTPPFAQNRPFIVVFRLKNNQDIWDMSTTNLTISDNKLNMINLKKEDFETDQQVWNALRQKSKQSTKKPGLMFRKLLDKMGIKGVLDLDEESIIADMEPVQAVFFDIRQLETITVIDNKVELADHEKTLKILSRASKKKKRLNIQTEEWILQSFSEWFDEATQADKTRVIGMLILYARRSVGSRWPELENLLNIHGTKDDWDTYFSSDYGIG